MMGHKGVRMLFNLKVFRTNDAVRVKRGWPTARDSGWSATGETFSSSIMRMLRGSTQSSTQLKLRWCTSIPLGRTC
eukprot:864067-Pelagomonas_calceolata.AAC.2